MVILGIETSCDETAAAIINAKKDDIAVMSNIVSSQIDIHRKYGGVIPEVAAREHVKNILPVINETLNMANIKKVDAPRKIDAIAVTVGPGLITSLMTGVETAKSLAFSWQIPIIGINHIAGHIYANFIDAKDKKTKIKFPAIILTVSGGHTMLVHMKNHGKFKIIGETRDDAAGEAFDKAAQLLNIGYPGGPAIAMLASQWKSKNQNPNFKKNSKSKIQNYKPIILPRPMINDRSLDFSFSGLKTALLYEIQKDPSWKKRKEEYASEFQEAVVDVLISKTVKAAKQYQSKTVMLSGGVAANELLRQNFVKMMNKELPKITLNIPDLKYTTDNAAMIAVAGYYSLKQKKLSSWENLKADSNFCI